MHTRQRSSRLTPQFPPRKHLISRLHAQLLRRLPHRQKPPKPFRLPRIRLRHFRHQAPRLFRRKPTHNRPTARQRPAAPARIIRQTQHQPRLRIIIIRHLRHRQQRRNRRLLAATTFRHNPLHQPQHPNSRPLPPTLRRRATIQTPRIQHLALISRPRNARFRLPISPLRHRRRSTPLPNRIQHRRRQRIFTLHPALAALARRFTE